MSIQFKFRSCVKFESLEIDGQPSICVGDLRAKIVRHKNLNPSEGFDLLFSDAVTGFEYNSYAYQIPSGSSVIVRRVPAILLPSSMTPANFDDELRIRNSKSATPSSISLSVEEDVVAFGVDLYPILKTATDNSLQFDKQNCVENEMPKIASRSLPSFMAQRSDITFPNQRMDGAQCQAVLKVDLSSDFKCSLCSFYLKEAMLIPCCQHSFCQNCISTALIEKGRCPKCESSKCQVADLIPNITLRRAIEQFLESKIRMLRIDAPDNESGTQARDYCSVVPKGHRGELKVLVSPSASRGGSNQIIGEKFSISPDFQWENQPDDIHQRPLHEEGGDRTSKIIRRHSKGDCTCYMCGSPDHSMRDCPLASNHPLMLPAGNPMFPGPMSGYVSPFWNGITDAPMRPPYSNMYANSGMMHFNPAMLPASPYVVPPYMPWMYGGQPVPSGVMREGVMNSFTPQYQASSKYPSHPSETLELRNSKNRRIICNESLRSGRSYGDHYDNERCQTTEPEKSRKYKDRVEREKSASYFEDRFTQRSREKNKEYHYRDGYRVHTSDRSDSRPHKRRSNPRAEHCTDKHSYGWHAYDLRTSRDLQRNDHVDHQKDHHYHKQKRV